MWEVLAPIVRWPLYSPARFASVVVVALVMVFLAGEVNDSPGQSADAPSAVSPTVGGEQASSLPSSPSAASDDPSTVPPDVGPRGIAAPATDELSVDPAEDQPSAAAATVAAAFVAAWARPDLDAQTWADGVRPLVTDELWSTGLSSTDPARTPQVTVRDEPRQVAMNAEEGVFDVPTTGPWVRVHVSHALGAETWLVSRVEPVS